jgi:hypothetical protein
LKGFSSAAKIIKEHIARLHPTQQLQLQHNIILSGGNTMAEKVVNKLTQSNYIFNTFSHLSDLEENFSKNFTIVLNEDRVFDVVEAGVIFGLSKQYKSQETNSKSSSNTDLDSYPVGPLYQS